VSSSNDESWCTRSSVEGCDTAATRCTAMEDWSIMYASMCVEVASGESVV